MEANKEESERCIEIAKKCLRENNRDKAIKFLQKAQKLNPHDKKIQNLMEKVGEKLGEDCTTQNGSATGDYGAFTDEYENQPRSRFHNSKSQPNFTKQTSPGEPSSSADPTANRTRDRSKSRPRTSSSGAGAESYQRTTSTPQLGVDYTKEQLEAVQRVRRSKDYYEILNVSKDFTENDLKKQYRKLALQFHPDKNHAPGATEAFKAIGNAYAVLSDPKKRERYDMYGTETQSSSNSHRHDYDYSRGFEADMTAEEIFNMFFGGGYPQGNIRRRAPGHYYYQYSADNDRRNEAKILEDTYLYCFLQQVFFQSGLGVLLQLMPILILIFLSLFSQLLVADPPYSMSRNSKYTDERRTTELQVVYYVKPDFKQQYAKNIGRVEQQVEEEYIDNLRNACFRERNQKETMMWRAKLYGDAGLYERAQSLRTPSCDRLAELYR